MARWRAGTSRPTFIPPPRTPRSPARTISVRSSSPYDLGPPAPRSRFLAGSLACARCRRGRPAGCRRRAAAASDAPGADPLRAQLVARHGVELAQDGVDRPHLLGPVRQRPHRHERPRRNLRDPTVEILARAFAVALGDPPANVRDRVPCATAAAQDRNRRLVEARR